MIMIKNFKTFEHFSPSPRIRTCDPESVEQLEMWCKQYLRPATGRYTINPDRTVSVDGNVNLSRYGLDRLPIKFKEVSGSFFCYDNQLLSLEGCPEKIGGSLNCSSNRLSSLKGGPIQMGIGSVFNCCDNQLTSLEGTPETKFLYFDNNKITNFQGIPEFWEGKLSISGNPAYEVIKGFRRYQIGDPSLIESEVIYWIKEFDVIQGDRIIKDRLEEVYHCLHLDPPKHFEFEYYTLV